MKTRTQNFILLVFLSLISSSVSATSYTWTGSVSTDWNNANNWSPVGTVNSGDNVTIPSTTRKPHLDTSRSITNFSLTTDTLFLDGYELTVNGTFTGTSGVITGGSLKIRGTVTTFNGTTFNCPLDISTGQVRFNTGVFNEVVRCVDTGGASSTGSGGCTFQDSLILTHTGTGTYLKLSTTTANTYNGPVVLTNTSDHEIMMSDAGTSYFNNNIIVNSTSTGGIIFGNNGGASELVSGKTISIGSSGFTNNYLTLKNFTQVGSTSHSLTLTGSGVLVLNGCIFNGDLAVSGPGFLLKNNTFNASSSFTKAGTGNYQSDGNNTYNSDVTFSNTGSSGRIRLSSISADYYYGNATFQSTGQDVQVSYAGGSVFEKNVSINNSHINFNSGTGLPFLVEQLLKI